jgi:hypothetical protein
MAMCEHLSGLGLDASAIAIAVEDDAVTVSGEVDDRNMSERMVLSLGNVTGIRTVRNNIEVAGSDSRVDLPHSGQGRHALEDR